MRRLSLRLSAVVLLAGGLSVAMSMGAVAQPRPGVSPNATGNSSLAHAAPSASSSGSSNSYWTLSMNFDTGTFTYYLNPLTKTGKTLSGTLEAPACSGALQGTLKKSHLKLTVPDFGSPCDPGFTITLKGKMKLHAGTTSGTFTSNYECATVCTFTGVRTS